MTNVVPPQFQALFRYDEQWKVLICRQHRVAVPLKSLPSHLRSEHWRQIPKEVRPFIDVCGIKGPKDRYNDKEILPGVRQFVYEHAQIVCQFMHDCWVARVTISEVKSVFGAPGIEIVGFCVRKP